MVDHSKLVIAVWDGSASDTEKKKQEDIMSQLKKNLMIRQGDLLFIPVEKLPKETRETKETVLAKGESTGHAHRLSPGAQAAILMAGTIMYLRVVQACQVVHEEHKAVDLQEGLYEVRRQAEYSPNGWRQVND